jgi:hypothetical protein
MKLWCYVSEVAVDAVIGSVIRGIQEGMCLYNIDVDVNVGVGYNWK